jgi:malate synthase
LDKIRQQIGEQRFARSKYKEARELFVHLTQNDQFIDFLTLPGYDLLD